MAATFQLKYPNACKLSSDGYFGSKFVTVVVTGKLVHSLISQLIWLLVFDCVQPSLNWLHNKAKCVLFVRKHAVKTSKLTEKLFVYLSNELNILGLQALSHDHYVVGS